MQVVAVISDGAASNARMFDMLMPDKTSPRQFSYKGMNPFFDDVPLFAIYDPSHTIKV